VRISVFTSVFSLCLGTAWWTSAQSPDSGAARARVTFNRDIAPIIGNKCAGCHRQGGGAPFSLTSYADVRRRATLVAEVTHTRAMPPWKPKAPPGVFAEDRRLTDEQIALIQRWVKEGALEGESARPSGSAIESKEWELGNPDLVVTMPAAYVLPAAGPDTIRSFVIKVPSARDRNVRGIEFHPEASGVVHHANIKIDVTGSSRRIDAADEDPGFDGSGPTARFPDGQFLGWTPGQRPHVSTDNVWVLPAGADLVIELHMTPTGRPERIQPRIGLLFTDRAPQRTPYMLRLSNQRLDIPPGLTRYVNTDEYELPVDVELLAIQPHAHNLARTVTGVAHLPDGTIESLIEIDDWDFRWQDVYRYVRPIHLPRGTRLAMQYTYDNSDRNPKNPHRPPRRVTFGQTTDAEMGDLWFQLATATPKDRAALEADFGPKMLREDTAGDELMVATNPRDARLRRDLAYCYEAAGRVPEAIAELERSVELAPDSAEGHYQLGTLLLKQRRLDEAVRRFERAIALEPDWSESYNNLGAAWFLRGDLAAASRAFDEAIRRDSRNPQAYFNRGRVLVAERRPSDALVAFKESLRIKGDDPETLSAAASTSVATGQLPDAIRLYREALGLNPDLVTALADLAWILSAAEPRDDLRVAEAVRLAERAATLTSFADPIVLDTLAASYFAARRLSDAIRTAEQALAAAERSGNSRAVQDIGARLRTYRAQPQ
jgi:tetratricopeptide (TPR) repeat protein/mono/diheme cytochrome c family protein